jgi:hypothetical protein
MNEIITNKYITQKRLNAYSDFDEYKSNLLISKNMYIPLSVLEVSIRNSVDSHFSNFYGNGWLLNETAFLQRDAIRKITEAKARIEERGEELTREKLVAELSFGFWTSLFKQPYDRVLRFSSLKQIFSHLPKKEEKIVDRKYISAQLNLIRAFRNRIFHYEKVIGKDRYMNIENNILEILSYLHVDLSKFVKGLNSE